MAFKVQPKKKDVQRFEFELPTEDGEDVTTHSLPLIRYISVEAAEAFELGRDITGLMLAADDESTRKALRTLDADQLKGLLQAWEAESEDELGESSAS